MGAAGTTRQPDPGRRIALDAGLHNVFTGNVHDSKDGTSCHAALIVRDWYDIRRYELPPEGRSPHCQTAIAGRFGKALGRDDHAFWARRIPVHLGV